MRTSITACGARPPPTTDRRPRPNHVVEDLNAGAAQAIRPEAEITRWDFLNAPRARVIIKHLETIPTSYRPWPMTHSGRSRLISQRCASPKRTSE